jgi:hypothetical protein
MDIQSSLHHQIRLPVLFIVAAFLAPETPWILVKKCRYGEAAKSLSKLGILGTLAIPWLTNYLARR